MILGPNFLNENNAVCPPAREVKRVRSQGVFDYDQKTLYAYMEISHEPPLGIINIC
jgi:hypothetical protein